MAGEVRQSVGGSAYAVRGGVEASAYQRRGGTRFRQRDRAPPLARGIGGHAGQPFDSRGRIGSSAIRSRAGTRALEARVRSGSVKGGEDLEGRRGCAVRRGRGAMAGGICKRRGRGDRAFRRGGVEATACESWGLARAGRDRASPLARRIVGSAGSSSTAGERVGSNGFGPRTG